MVDNARMKTTPVSALHLNDGSYGLPKNPRFIRDARFKALVESIRDFPEAMPARGIVTDERGVILGGNMRFRACLELKMKAIPAEWVKQLEGLTDAQKRRFIIMDNRPYGEDDMDALANEWDMDELLKAGFEEKELTGLNEGNEPQDAEPQIDRAEELNEKWKVKTGDLWHIGDHRLLCGDSTKAEDVARVLGDRKPVLMVTDPPYGVEYDANWRNEADRVNGKPYGARAIGKVTNDDRADWREAWAANPSSVLPMPFLRRARVTTLAPARRVASAILAVSRMSAGRSERPAVNLLVAGNAERDSVGNVKAHVRVGGKRGDMMSVYLSCFPAVPTGESIACIDRFSPRRQLTRDGCADAIQRNSAFPCSGLGSCARLSGTGPRTENSTRIAGQERTITSRTGSFRRRMTPRPATLSAKLRERGSVRLDEIGCSADRALLFDSRVFRHDRSISHSKPNATQYCAVILERMVTAFPTLDIFKGSAK